MKQYLHFFVFLFLLTGIAGSGFSQTATYTVTKTTDPNPKLYNFTDSLCSPQMYGTLQWAIRKSIDDGTVSQIVFNIPGTGPHTIMLNYELPTIIKGDLTIDATTQPGYQGEPLVIIDGQDTIERGLYFHDYSNYTVKGLGIQHFIRRGILFEYANNILAEYNVITLIRNNDPDHTATAIRIVGNPKVGHSDAIIRYNYLGTNAQQETTIGCDDAGILVGPDANNNLIFGNTIAYNHQSGIYINSAQQNKLSQNLIFGQAQAISLVEGANGNKVAPDSLQYNDSTQVLSGIAEPFDTIEVFGSTGAENANEYLTSAIADNTGHWQVSVGTQWNYYIATATNLSTSPLSLPLLNSERSLSIQTCQPDSLPVNITGVTPGDIIVINITLPNDIVALNDANVSGNATILSIDTTNVNYPQYEIIVGDSTNSFTLYYFVYAGCETFSATTQHYQNYIQIHDGGNIENDTTEYNINTPVIVFIDSLSQNLIYDAFLSTPFQRTFYYVNTSSQGNFTGVIEFKDSTISPTGIQFLDIGLQYSGNSTELLSNLTDSSITYQVKVKDMEYLDSVVFVETLQLNQCPNNYNNITYFDARYGCDSTNLCSLINSSHTETHLPRHPQLNEVLLTPGYQSCWQDTLERIIRIINTGDDMAESVQFDIISGDSPYSSYYQNNITDHPVEGFEIYKDSAGFSVPIPFTGINSTYYNYDTALITTQPLLPNDTIYLKYYEIVHCIDSSEYDNYFNASTYMNWEGFPRVTLNHPCHPVSKEYPDSNCYYHATWRHSYSLSQNFNNLIGTMPDGDSEWFNISSNNLNLGPTQINAFVFHADSCEIDVELDLEPGLGLVDSNLFLSAVYGSDTSYLYPTVIEASSGFLDTAAGNIITARFNIPDSMFQEYTSHCHGFIDKPLDPFNHFFANFKVNFNLFADCNFAADTPSTITEKVFLIPNTNCSNCKIPLAKVQDDIFILCPGCWLPGWNISELNIKRKNFGYADNDNNNFPDAYPMLPADTSLVNVSNVIQGDTIDIYFKSHTSDGEVLMFDNIGFPYIYGQILLRGNILKHIRFIGGYGEIDDTLGTHNIIIPQTAGIIYDSTNIALDISIDSLQSYSSSTLVDSFNINSALNLHLLFVIDSNLVFPMEPNSYFSTQDISVFVNMSGTSYTGIDIKPDAANNTLDTLLAMSPEQRAELNYWCTGYVSKLNAIGTDYDFKLYVQHYGCGNPNYPVAGGTPCQNIIGFKMYPSVGQEVNMNDNYSQTPDQQAWNSFSYELRNLWMLDTLMFTFPDYYKVNKIVFQNTQLTFSNTNNQTVFTSGPWSIPEFVYDTTNNCIQTDTSIAIFPAANFGCITQQNNDSLFAYDETKRYRVFLYLDEAYCGIPPETSAINDSIFSYWSNFPGTSSGDTVIRQGLHGNFTKPLAVLQTQTLLQEQDYLNADLFWNMMINAIGNILYGNGIVNNRAENSFLYFISPNNSIVVDSVVRTNTGIQVPVVNIINGDSLYGLGRIGTGWTSVDSAHVSIYASYDCSQINATDSLYVVYGWNCKEYPDTLENACFIDTTVLYVNLLNTGFQAAIHNPDTVNICDTVYYDIDITATGQGSVENIQVNLQESITGEYHYIPNTAYLVFHNDTEFIPPYPLYNDTLTWVLDSANILSHFETDTLHFFIGIAGNCDFGNNPVNFMITAENYCGKILDTIFLSGIPVITGYPPLDSIGITVSAGNLINCNQTIPVTVTVTNLGNAPTGSFDTVSVQLTPAAIYAGGYTLADSTGQMLYFSLPDNIQPDSSFTFDFTMIDDTTHSCSDTLIITACTHPVSQYTCDTNICYYASTAQDVCDTAIITVHKPNFGFTAFSPVSFCDSTNWQVAVSIANTSDITAYNDTVLFYCYSGGSLSCLLGQFAVDSINGNTTYTDTVNLTNTCTTCDSIVAVVSGCLCHPDTSEAIIPSYAYIPTANFSIADSCLVYGNTIQFIADSIPETDYYWEFSDGTTSTDINPVHVFDNYGYYCVKLTVTNECGSDTFSLPKPIYVNISTCACDGGWYDYDYKDGYTIHSYDVETWGAGGLATRLFVEGDIIIEPHAQLIIDDSVTAEFAPNGRIIVQAGGKLTIRSNVTLTSIFFAPWTSSKNAPFCAGNMWQGIEVWGNNDMPHVVSEQGIVEILDQDNVTIENAHIGILSGARNMDYLCDNTAPLFDSGKGCGLVRINSKAHFLNDGIGIKFLSREPLYNIGGYWSGNVIQNCDFRTTNELLRDTEYLATHPHAYPNAQNPWACDANDNKRTGVGIWMQGIKGQEIDSCSFNNEQIGILSFDAKYDVHNCAFVNHYYGIRIENTLSGIDNRHEIVSCNFNLIPNDPTKKGAAIYIRKGRYDYIHDNVFGVMASGTPQNLNRYGVYMMESGGLNVSNNKFNRFTTGVSVYNSGHGGGYVGAWNSAILFTDPWFGNQFNLCKYSISTSSDNSLLRLKCNNCNNDPNYQSLYGVNFYNYGLLANQGSMPPWGVNPMFKPRYAAGNEFQPDDQNFYKEIHSANYTYNYYRHNNPPKVIPNDNGSGVPINITPIGVDKPLDNSVACPPLLAPAPNPLVVPLSSPVFTKLDSLKTVIDSLDIQYQTALADLDGGETDYLLDLLASHGSKFHITNELINHSPLSDTVLITAITRRPAFGPVMFSLIMLYNLPVSHHVEPYFYERITHLPPPFRYYLKRLQAYMPYSTTPEQYSREKDRVTEQRQLYLNDIIRLLTDSAANRRSDAITLLENENTPYANRLLTATYLADSNFTGAANVLSETGDPVYMEYAGMLLSLYQSGKTLYDLDSSQIAFVREVAYGCPPSAASGNAASVLMLLFGEDVPECPPGMDIRSFAVTENPPATMDYADEANELLGNAYPNPAITEITIPYELPDKVNAILVVFDKKGHEITQYQAQQGKHSIKIDVRQWQPGTYTYSLLIKGFLPISKQVTIVK